MSTGVTPTARALAACASPSHALRSIDRSRRTRGAHRPPYRRVARLDRLPASLTDRVDHMAPSERSLRARHACVRHESHTPTAAHLVVAPPARGADPSVRPSVCCLTPKRARGHATACMRRDGPGGRGHGLRLRPSASRPPAHAAPLLSSRRPSSRTRSLDTAGKEYSNERRKPINAGRRRYVRAHAPSRGRAYTYERRCMSACPAGDRRRGPARSRAN
ncbi:hypothetical protein GUJ93_ZPchr0006g44491 [Zizania palustris]|uniref:Uncharacterized protein n=1 Tax=Zizania palustris TaxID=103762 RepID=A0A8J5T1F4_ZIZPA|nr:hypothetical protein GUJ93_ZPchr0006g44491 [Zizania palustris]